MAAKVSQAHYPARVMSITGDSSYATGGYALSASHLALANGPNVVGLNDGGAIIALYDAVNKKVKFITAATGAEVAAASDQSANTVKLLVYGP